MGINKSMVSGVSLLQGSGIHQFRSTSSGAQEFRSTRCLVTV